MCTVVGFLRTTVAAGSAHLVGAFRQGLNEAGFVEGQNLAVEYRWADDQDDRISRDGGRTRPPPGGRDRGEWPCGAGCQSGHCDDF
jgi:hypothetical protein